MLDLPPVTEIRSSSLALLRPFLLFIAFTLLCALIAIGKIGHVVDGSYKQPVMLFGAVCFGALTIFLLWRLLHAGEVLLRLTPEHLWIKRGKGGFTVSWTDVIGISSTPKNSRFEYLVLEIAPDQQEKYKSGAMNSALWKFNTATGINGIPISATGSDVSLDRLEMFLRRYLQDAGVVLS